MDGCGDVTNGVETLLCEEGLPQADFLSLGLGVM